MRTGSEEPKILAKEHEAVAVASYLNLLNDTAWIPGNTPITCSKAICAFLQYTDGREAKEVKNLGRNINDHGCKKCGSCPVVYPESNDVLKGKLTFNYIATDECGVFVEFVLSFWTLPYGTRRGLRALPLSLHATAFQ